MTKRKEETLEQLIHNSMLYDFYGGLLTAKQSQAVELYHLENWSLAEIAEKEGVSRQAIHDLLQRSEKLMADYEEKLGLVARYMKQRAELINIYQLFRNIYNKCENDPHLTEELKILNQKLTNLIDI